MPGLADNLEFGLGPHVFFRDPICRNAKPLYFRLVGEQPRRSPKMPPHLHLNGGQGR